MDDYTPIVVEEVEEHVGEAGVLLRVFPSKMRLLLHEEEETLPGKYPECAARRHVGIGGRDDGQCPG
jgi:hypothetical protein